MKIALITDTHFGARNDNLAFNDYFYKFWEETFFPYIEEHGIDTVIHLGDVMDRRKFVSYKIAQDFRQRFIQKFVDMGVNLHMLVGNHDTFYKNTNDVNSLGELIEGIYSGITCYPNPTTIGIDGNFLRKFDTVFSRHFHKKSDNGHIYYLGNTYQMTWADNNCPKGFHIFDTETRELERIVNTYTIFEKVYYDETTVDYDKFDVSKLKEKFVKIIVVNKKDFYK